MVDIVSKEVRSKIMSGIRGKNTKPEMIIRKGLFSKGLRYKLHDQRLPGKPDLVFIKYRAVIFVNGCFWHGHDCKYFREPKSNNDFWNTKIDRNRDNDVKNKNLLLLSGWRVMTIWECALRKASEEEIIMVVEDVVSWLKSSDPLREARGSE